ncbi:MAG TPA: non-homologous end-joining DNA ligase [Solirubrobacteraceae bacterium]|nr:non-homologous end-joining DNA ligase [Solirubrobacteraceae bacterium]
MTERIRAGRRTVQITHADRSMFPRAGLTKLDLARHYDRVAPAMVPHVRDRPLALDVYPDGVQGGGYLMKQIPAHFPDWIARATVRKRGGEVTHVLANDRATLVYLAGQNVVTLHAWPSRADRPDHPDRLIFDLDPSRERFVEVRAAARALGDLLRDLGLAPFAMTTGSRGLHVVVPLRRREPFDTVRAFARAVAEELVAGDPKQLTIAQRKADRGKRIFVDVNRNGYAQHAVAAYAVRPRATAPVATPLQWDELEDRRLSPGRWTVTTIGDRLDSEGDPWKAIGSHARALGPAIRRMDRA